MTEGNSNEETFGGAGVETPRVWLKAFWGFDPASEGYLGFTRAGDRVRFLEQARPTDLVLIYGADTKETTIAQRKQALGFLQVALDEISDVDKISPEALALKRQSLIPRTGAKEKARREGL